MSFDQKVEGSMRNSYLQLRNNTDKKTQLIRKGLADTPRIINSVYQVEVKPTTQFSSPVTLIPTYPDLPMEDVYPRVAETDIRELYLRQVGNGRVAYIPGDLDRSFWQLMNVDHRQLLSNVIEWGLDEEPLAKVTGPGIVDVNIWRQAQSMMVHLANLTNPMMMEGPFRELIPIDTQVTKGANVTTVQLLMSGQKPTFDRKSSSVTVKVPRLLDTKSLPWI